MQFDRRELKRSARLAMRDHKPSIYLITAVYLVVFLLLDTLTVKLQYPGVGLSEAILNMFDEAGLTTMLQASLRQNYLSKVLVFAIRIMMAILSAGFAMTCLAVARREDAGFGTLLDPFSFLLKVLWLNILTSVLIALWSLLLVIPGVIAVYRYSFATYILLDNPSKPVMQCIHESSVLTDGYKWELFVLSLSFIGWIILSMIPVVQIYTLPYMEITQACYYDRILKCSYQQPQETTYGF